MTTSIDHPSPVSELNRGAGTAPVLRLRDATLSFGQRQLFAGLDLDVVPGEFITILGSNGSGKSSLLKAILGLQPLSSGSIAFLGRPPTRGNRRIGYIPQQRPMAPGTAMRGCDLVGFGLDGHRLGMRLFGRAKLGDRVQAAISAVRADAFAHRPIGQLSGGEQQRLRVAQALVCDPAMLLCDEPLSSLDVRNQHEVSQLLDHQRLSQDTPVLFVTHDINPVLTITDRVLYLAEGKHVIGTADQVLRSDVLSDLYRTPIEVATVGEQIVVLGAPGQQQAATEKSRMPR